MEKMRLERSTLRVAMLAIIGLVMSMVAGARAADAQTVSFSFGGTIVTGGELGIQNAITGTSSNTRLAAQGDAVVGTFTFDYAGAAPLQTGLIGDPPESGEWGISRTARTLASNGFTISLAGQAGTLLTPRLPTSDRNGFAEILAGAETLPGGDAGRNWEEIDYFSDDWAPWSDGYDTISHFGQAQLIFHRKLGAGPPIHVPFGSGDEVLQRILDTESWDYVEFYVEVKDSRADGTHAQFELDCRIDSVTPNVPGSPDASPPATTASLSAPAGNNGWYTGPVQVTLSANDDDGSADVASTYYAVDGGAQQTYAAPFTVSGDGSHTIVFWSVDRAGNEEQPHPSTAFKIDATPPSMTISTTPHELFPANGQMVRVTVQGIISDAGSGVDRTIGSFSVVDDYGTVQPSGPAKLLPLQEGTVAYFFQVLLEAKLRPNEATWRHYTITATGRDNAGNFGSARAVVSVPRVPR